MPILIAVLISLGVGLLFVGFLLFMMCRIDYMSQKEMSSSLGKSPFEQHWTQM